MEKNLLTYSEVLLENEALYKENQTLKELVVRLSERVGELEKQAGKTSANSSKPPSTDGFKKKIQNNRELSGKKSGGQKGHKGHTLKLAPLEDVSKVTYLAVKGKCDCGLDLSISGKVLGYECRQVWNIPELKPYIEEFHIEKKKCICGCEHKAACELPYSIQYGSNVRALSCYLQNEQFLPVARTQSLMADIFGFEQLSEGVILASSETCYTRLEDWESEQKVALQSAAVMHVDETGFEVNGDRHWGHVCCTEHITLYQHHEKRGKEAHKAHGIVPNFRGLLVHDRYSSYNSYECNHSLCNPHLLRDLKSLIEDGHAWATEMYSLINRINKGAYCPVLLEITYATILEQGFSVNPMPVRTKAKGKIKKTASLNLLECYRDKKTEILRFYYEKNAPFDNNQAERDLRMFKLKQKISGTFRTLKGAKIFCSVRSFISTLKKQDKNVWQNLSALFAANSQFVDLSE